MTDQKTPPFTTADVRRRLWDEANYFGKGASADARVAALAVLAKHLGMLPERLNISGVQVLGVGVPGTPLDINLDAERFRD